MIFRRRPGFALLTALWAIATATILAAAAALVGRESLDAARNRSDAERAFWRAEDCLARAREMIDGVLSDAGGAESAERAWRWLDARVDVAPLALDPGCDVVLRPSGSTLDLNAASAEQLLRMFTMLYGASRAYELVDALLDWRDVDDEQRPWGAEAAWYREQNRHPPRNDSLVDVRELARVRGFENLGELRELVGIDAGRVSLANAPMPVLASLPGFLDETVAAVIQLRERGDWIEDLSALAASLSPLAADSLLANYPELARLTTMEPEAWTVTSRGRTGDRGVPVAIVATMVRDGPRAVVLRRRGWL